MSTDLSASSVRSVSSRKTTNGILAARACGSFGFIARILGFALVVGALPSSPAQAFDFQDVARRAQQLAAKDYRKPESQLTQELKDLNYARYSEIRQRPERALWRDAKLPYEVTFFPTGWHFELPVKINEVTARGVRPLAPDPSTFDYGKSGLNAAKMDGTGYAGFRVVYPLNDPKRKDEVISFLGASYFRALGRGQRYGLSARGLAVDTALASGEEFPRFVEFWIVRPRAGTDGELVIFGLLDSPRASGAYRFVLKPGVDTAVDVSARLYLRDEVGKLGLAPLTSMFLFGRDERRDDDDFRPAVHDSDGLSVRSGNGEWLWRPLVNPKRLLVTSFSTTNPQGFGLMQRQREFSHFEDPYMRYELRPSTWVEPKGKWGAGRVELVQIPVPDENNDNIVAYWVPERAPEPRKAFDFAYRLLWQKDQESKPSTPWVAQTLRGRGYAHHPDGSIAFAVDFCGTWPDTLPPDTKTEALVSVDANAKLLERQLVRNEATGGWRLTLRLQRLDPAKPVEMRANLRAATETSETWSYILPPD